MKEFIRVFQYFIIKLKDGNPASRRFFEEDIDKEETNKIRIFFQFLLGNIYHKYVSLGERSRIWRYKAERERQKNTIIVEIIKYSKSVVIYLVVAVFITSLLDLLFWVVFPFIKDSNILTNSLQIPSSDILGQGLEIFIGSISAILGILFALYAVGFQLSTDRYSEKVTDFINEETVSGYFFSFLVFTDLFALIVFIKLQMFSQLPLMSFLFAVIFVCLSLLGILIFKSHYVSSMKPINIFRTLWRLIYEQFEVASNINNYKYKSWSLVTYAKRFSNRYLNICEDLYRDLKRMDNWNDASVVPIILAEILREYTNIVRFIDKEKGWWFYQKYEKVTSDNLALYTIKANYELKGRGPLHIPKFAEDWLESKILDFFDEITLDLDKDNSGKLITNISRGYKTFLVGDYDSKGNIPSKLIPGAFQNQEFEIFDKGLNKYFSLYKSVDFSKATIATSFLNDYFAISEAVLEEWDIQKIIKIAKSFYIEDQLDTSKSFLNNKGIPTYAREILLNYWERLEVEQVLEGKIITPVDRFVEELEDVFKTKRSEVIKKYLTSLFRNSNEVIVYLYVHKQLEYAGQFVKMQYEWISRLLHIGDAEIAETFATVLVENLVFVSRLPKEIIIEIELLEQLEKGFFVSLIKRKKDLFTIYSRAIMLTLLIVTQNEEDSDKKLFYIRMPIIWGGLVYLISELDREKHYITVFVRGLEKSFKQGWMVPLMKQVADLDLITNIRLETVRYHSWYMSVLNKMRDQLRKTPIREEGAMGYQEGYAHPSKFIQELGIWEMMEEEKCIEGFVEWIEKREEIKKLTLILTAIMNKYE